jgi:hypothetical protein
VVEIEVEQKDSLMCLVKEYFSNWGYKIIKKDINIDSF